MLEYKLFEITIANVDRKIELHNCLCQVTDSLEKLKQEANEFLTPHELEYFKTLEFPKRQATYLSGHFAAKRAIQYLNPQLNMTDIQLRHGIFGFPYIVAPQWIDHQVSISHSDTVGVAIAYQQACPMAIDIEHLNPARIETMESEMTAAEITLIRSKVVDYQRGVTIAWTSKESLSKALRCGLYIDFKYLELESFNSARDAYECTYKNFKQYQAYSMLLVDHVCTVVFPVKTSFSIRSI